MRQYELAIRIAQIHHLVDERKYKKALAVIQTLDMRQIKSLSDLKVFAEVYTRTEQFDAAKATYLRIYRKSRTRRVLHRLIYLSIRTNAIEDAEAYYAEYVHMHPSERDALILRYRIDKTKGVPIGELIHILQALKQEEYIEEWAYELAKLYHRAGRREECMRECEDILLWFGSGEIVERARVLIEHLEEKDPMPYIDDKDFTVPKKESPNPEDTGSLPDLKEFVKEQREQKREERRREREMRDDDYDEEFEDDYEDDADENDTKEEIEETREISKEASESLEDSETVAAVEESVENKENPTKEGKKRRNIVVKDPDEMEDDTDGYEDDYDEDDMFSNREKNPEKKGKGGIHKLSSSLLKFVMKDDVEFEEVDTEQISAKKKDTETAQTKKLEAGDTDRKKEVVEERNSVKETSVKRATKSESGQESAKKTVQPEAHKMRVHSQSGTGITQDLAKEIAAIVEMEHKEQLKEKAVTVIKDGPNLATDVLERMTKAAKQSVKKNYIPIDVEEIQTEEMIEDVNQGRASETKDAMEVSNEENLAGEVDVSIEKMADIGESAEETVSPEALQSEEITEKEPSHPDEISAEEQPQPDEPEEEDIKIYRSPLEGYTAPESKVIDNEFVGIPEIDVDDLPTTRALQRSFRDVLTLISGELDPSHFVLMGDGTERIVGVTKQIVRVMKETGYLSVGRIAKISSDQLNKMDLINFREQLKGNCLLIDGAADLLFPTISKMFSIMEEYHGDFVVILADEGATLDQLFRFVPVLAKKFKYIIDISQYTKEDYEI